MNPVLGFGLLRPLRRDRKADFAADGGDALVRSAVGQILGTRASSEISQGELPWRPEFGSLLYLLRHRKNDAVLPELARVYVVDALKRWEPRVIVQTVRVSREQQEGADVLSVRVGYSLIRRNVSGNQVVVPSIEQTVLVR
jgi:phage baseplate assembly protein W